MDFYPLCSEPQNCFAVVLKLALKSPLFRSNFSGLGHKGKKSAKLRRYNGSSIDLFLPTFSCKTHRSSVSKCCDCNNHRRCQNRYFSHFSRKQSCEGNNGLLPFSSIKKVKICYSKICFKQCSKSSFFVQYSTLISREKLSNGFG